MPKKKVMKKNRLRTYQKDQQWDWMDLRGKSISVGSVILRRLR